MEQLISEQHNQHQQQQQQIHEIQQHIKQLEKTWNKQQMKRKIIKVEMKQHISEEDDGDDEFCIDWYDQGIFHT